MFLFITFNPPQYRISELPPPNTSMDDSFSKPKPTHSDKQQVTTTSPGIDTALGQSDVLENSDDHDSMSDETYSQTEEEEAIKIMVAQLYAEREELMQRSKEVHAQFAEDQRRVIELATAEHQADMDYQDLLQELKAQLPPEPSEEDWELFHAALRETGEKAIAAWKALEANPYSNRMNAATDPLLEISRQIMAINHQIDELKSMLPGEN